jgi:hypothetical protein
MTKQATKGTARELLDFLDTLVQNGQSREGVVRPLRIAITKVLEASDVTGWLLTDVISLDVDAAVERFKRKTHNAYNPTTYQAYLSRIKRAISWYKASLEDVESSTAKPHAKPYQSKINIPSSRTPWSFVQHMAPTASYVYQSDVTTVHEAPVKESAKSEDTVMYPFPMQNGTMGRLHLPKAITRSDAKRLAQFIDALAVEEGDV